MDDIEFLTNLAQLYLEQIKLVGEYWGGDIELGAIAKLYNCPIRIVNLQDDKTYLINEEADGNEIALQYDGLHYVLLHNGQEHQISGDGDCLFNACIQGHLLNTDDNHQFIQSEKDGSEHSVALLREQVSMQLDADVIIARFQRILNANTEDELLEARKDLQHAPCVDKAVQRWHAKHSAEKKSYDLPSSDAQLVADIGEFHHDIFELLIKKLNVLGVALLENENGTRQLKFTEWQIQVREIKKTIAAFVKPNLPEDYHLDQAHKADMSAIYRQKVFSYEMKNAFLPELIELLEIFLKQADDDKNFDALNDAVSEKLDSVTFRLMDTVVDALQRNLGAYYQHGTQFKVDGKILERVHHTLNQKPYEFSEELFGENFQHFYVAMLASIKKEVDIYRETFAHDDGIRISLEKLRLDQKSSRENELLLSEQHLAHVDKMESEKDSVNKRNRNRKANLAKLASDDQLPEELTKHVMALNYVAHQKSVVDLLEDAPMPVDLKDGEGTTLLHIAHLLGLSEIATFLENNMLASKLSKNLHGFKPYEMRNVSALMHYSMLPTMYHSLSREVDIFSVVPDGLANKETLRNSADGLHTQLTTTYKNRLKKVERQLNWWLIGPYLHDGEALEQRKEFTRKLVSLMEGKPFANNQERARLICQEVDSYMQNVRGRFNKSPEKSQLYSLLRNFLVACEYSKDQRIVLASGRQYKPVQVSRDDMKNKLAQREAKILEHQQTIVKLENKLKEKEKNTKEKLVKEALKSAKTKKELQETKVELQETKVELQETKVKVAILMEWYEAEQSRKKSSSQNEDKSKDKSEEKRRGPGMY